MIAARHTFLAAALALAAQLISFVASPALADPTFPPLTGRVVDDAHILSGQTQSELTAKLADLEAKTGRQLVVVTLPSLQGYEIEDYGYQLGRAWGVGQKGQNNGVLFIVAPNEHKVRIEVGYGLEATITDALSSEILQTDVLPRFRTGDVEGGVVAGTDALIAQMSADPATAQANIEQATEASRPHGIPFGAIFGVFVFFIVISALFRGHGGGGMGWLLPTMILSSGSRGWGGSGWDGGGGGGFGGFSGGGGSFGGGGASGSW